MPKQFPNLRESFLEHAREILCKEGYAALSVRRLAGECRVANGTVYNYFRNKDELIAHIMMADWQTALAQMAQAAQTAQTVEAGMSGMYGAAFAFVIRYESIWRQYAQAGGSGGIVAEHHVQLREQIVRQLQTLFARTGQQRLLETAPLLAEMLLAAAVQPDLNEAQVLLLTRQLTGAE